MEPGQPTISENLRVTDYYWNALNFIFIPPPHDSSENADKPPIYILYENWAFATLAKHRTIFFFKYWEKKKIRE